MKPLRFGFVLDDMCLQRDIPDNDYWPNKLCSVYSATKAYFFVAPENTGYKVVDAVNSGRITEALNANIDILICHLGIFDMFMAEPDGVAADIACKEIIRQCQSAGTKVLFVDYGRCQPVIENYGGWCFTNIRNIHGYFIDLTNEFPDTAAHSDLFWAFNLQWTNESDYWLSDGINYSRKGHLFLADRLRAAIVPLVQQYSNERLITYACIGDSWTDTNTCYNAFDHWTRLVGDTLGAKLVCDASVGGWTLQRLYENQLIFTNEIDQVDQISWALEHKPDMIFMTITGNDTWNGYQSATKERGRAVINRLLENGVKKILWSFYAQVAWNEIASGYQITGEQMKERFVQLRQALRELAAEYPDSIVFIDNGMEEEQLNYYLHPENYGDIAHPHDNAWSYLAPYLINGFQDSYNALRGELNSPTLKIGTDSEWLNNPTETLPCIHVSNHKLSAPFRRKNRVIS